MKRLVFLYILSLLLSNSVFAQTFSLANQGEEIKYSVEWMGANIGTAELNFLGKTILYNDESILITFKTETFGFNDFDKIYGNPITYCPIRVERSLTIAGKEESILEEYEQGQNLLKITKISGAKAEEQIIKGSSINGNSTGKGKIQNVILLIYWLRSQNLKVGDSFQVVLPDSQYKVCVVKEEEIKVPLGKFNAYLIETEPEKIKLWIEVADRRLPLKIENPMFLTHSSMVATDISSKKIL